MSFWIFFAIFKARLVDFKRSPLFVGLSLILFVHGFPYSALANMTSSTGNISMDVNDDGNSEAILTTNGLGIGTSNPSSNLHVAGNSSISKTLSVGSSSTSNSNLHITGSLGHSFERFTSGNRLDSHSIAIADSSAGNFTLSLPVASTTNAGQIFTVKKSSTDNQVKIFVQGNATIDGQPGVTLSEGNFGSLKVISYSGNWHILSISNNESTSFWNPSSISTEIWYDAADQDNISKVSSSVNVWLDKSGNGRHASQTTAGDQPTFESTGLNQLPTVFFEGANTDHLEFTSASGNWIVYMITKPTAGSFKMLLTSATFGGNQTELPKAVEGNGSSAVFTVAGSGNPAGLEMYANGSTVAVPKTRGDMYDAMINDHPNGVLIKFGDLSVAPDHFDRLGDNLSGWQTEGRVSEFICVDSSTAAADLEKIEGYLAWKWGLEAKLPSSHTYKDGPP